ncbi:MAG: hypothetical protein LC541_08005 [Candidatus Thiodiazotropha sp.]|nr:hypothetical protein [Candidatus Thiodiazotropha sp.]MCM8883224.1 hypothetical protein [Candidatus Thiodiazotropha sp.]MCM8920620.1 hypothetical protein [Candidatus Thiodiazotropha sp.]
MLIRSICLGVLGIFFSAGQSIAAQSDSYRCPVNKDNLKKEFPHAYTQDNGEDLIDCTDRSSTSDSTLLSRFPADTLVCKLTHEIIIKSAIAPEQSTSFCFFIDDGVTKIYRKRDTGDQKYVRFKYTDKAKSNDTSEKTLIVSPLPNKGCSGWDDCDTSWLIGKPKNTILTPSGYFARLPFINENARFLEPTIVSSKFNGNISEAIIVSVNSYSLELKSKAGKQEIGRLEITMDSIFGERALVTVPLAAPENYDDTPGTLGLMIELALAKKLIADERFLRGVQFKAFKDDKCNPSNQEPCGIYNKYDEALDTLPQCISKKGESKPKHDCTSLKKSQQATLKLARADILYRKKLLRHGYAFIGSHRSLSPTTPHQELIKMRDLLERMRSASERMEKWEFRSAGLQLKDVDNEAKRIYQMGQINSQQSTANIQDVKSSNHDAAIKSYEARLEYLKSYMQELSDRSDKLSKDQDNLNSQAGALIQSGIAAATGLPVNEIKALSQGNVEAAVKDYVKSQAGNHVKQLGKDLLANSEIAKSVSVAYSEFREKEAEIKKVVKNMQQYKREFDNLRNKFDQTVEYAKLNAAEIQERIGQKLYEEIEEARKEIDGIVESTKPVGTLLKAAHKSIQTEHDKLRKYNQSLLALTVNIKITKQEAHKLKAEITEQLLANIKKDEFITLSSQILSIIEHIDNPQLMHKHLVSLYPNILEVPQLKSVIDSADSKLRDRIRAELLKLKHESHYAGGPVVVYYDKHSKMIHIRLNDGGNYGSVAYKDIIEELYRSAPTGEIEELRAVIMAVKDHIEDTTLFLLVNRMRGIDYFTAEIDRKLRETIDDNLLKKEWERLRKNPLFNAKSIKNAPAYSVAAQVAYQKSPTAKEPPAPPPKTPTNDSSASSNTGMSPEANLALTTALNAAFPGAGIALQLGQTWASMDANRELLDSLENEMVQATAEHYQLVDSINKANIGSVIAKLERERALALAEATKAQLEQYNFKMDLVHDQSKYLDQLLRLYRPYFFYNAEMLRERFEAFDRSLSIWSSGEPSSGFLAQQIQNDPRNTRLALDSEIHLFGWLNREREATKTDPHHLVNHWQQLVALADEYCADYSCKPGTGTLGNIATTLPLRLFKDIAGNDEWDNFLKWRDSEDRVVAHTFPLTLTTAHKLVPRDYVNVRLLDVNIVPVTRNGAKLNGNILQLKHTGYSKIPHIDPDGMLEWLDEQLLPSTSMPPSNNYPFDLNALAERFQTQVNQASLLSLRGFEGYGLYGNYELSINDTALVDQIEDFEVQIAFIYQQSDDYLTEGDLFSRLLELGEPCKETKYDGKTLETNCSAFVDVTIRKQKDDGSCSPHASTVRLTKPALIQTWLDTTETTLSKGDQPNNTLKQNGLACVNADVTVLEGVTQ